MLTRSLDGITCFRPNPLPPILHLDMETALILSQADHSIGKLWGAGRMLPNPHLLIAPFLRREANDERVGPSKEALDLLTSTNNETSRAGNSSSSSMSLCNF